MALINIEYGSVANSSPLNNNFNYLDGKIEEASTAITSVNANLQTRLANVQSTLESSIASVESEMQDELDEYKEEVNATLDNFRDEVFYKKPAMIPIVDWGNMATIAGVSQETLRPTSATGVKYYTYTAGNLHGYDVYLKENFTNYPRILVLYGTPQANVGNGVQISSKIFNSWELDYLLQVPNDYYSVSPCTSITSNEAWSGYYYNIWGYNQPVAIGGVTYTTTRKYFLNNYQANCNLVEIYGLTNSVIDSYIVDGATAFSSGWLSETEDGEALTPSVGTLYIVRTAGSYLDKSYKWTGTEYEEVTDAIL